VPIRDAGKETLNIYFYKYASMLMYSDVIQDTFSFNATAHVSRQLQWLKKEVID
jgi:hypothetical protein